MCLREASDHLAHAELAGKLEEAVEGDRARSGSQVAFLMACGSSSNTCIYTSSSLKTVHNSR